MQALAVQGCHAVQHAGGNRSNGGLTGALKLLTLIPNAALALTLDVAALLPESSSDASPAAAAVLIGRDTTGMLCAKHRVCSRVRAPIACASPPLRGAPVQRVAGSHLPVDFAPASGGASLSDASLLTPISRPCAQPWPCMAKRLPGAGTRGDGQCAIVARCGRN